MVVEHQRHTPFVSILAHVIGSKKKRKTKEEEKQCWKSSQAILAMALYLHRQSKFPRNNFPSILGRQNLLDQFRFLGNCPPTPPLSQRQHLRLTWGKMLG